MRINSPRVTKWNGNQSAFSTTLPDRYHCFYTTYVLCISLGISSAVLKTWTFLGLSRNAFDAEDFFSLLHIPTIYLCYMSRGKEWKGKRDSWARQKCLVRAELKGAFPLKQVCVTLQAGQHPIASSRILPEPTGLPAFKVFPGLYFIVDHQYSHSSPSLENKQKFILMGEI